MSQELNLLKLNKRTRGSLLHKASNSMKQESLELNLNKPDWIGWKRSLKSRLIMLFILLKSKRRLKMRPGIALRPK